MNFEEFMENLEEYTAARMYLKQECMIYQRDRKIDIARMFGVWYRTFFHVPYDEYIRLYRLYEGRYNLAYEIALELGMGGKERPCDNPVMKALVW